MTSGNVALVLIYEPASAKGRPVPLVRIDDPELAARAAQSAIRQAEVQAAAIADADEFLGEVEQAEVRRLRDVLAILIPGLKPRDWPCAASVM
jgi:hypothetical protein